MVGDKTLKWIVLPRIFVLRWIYILSLSGSFSFCSFSQSFVFLFPTHLEISVPQSELMYQPKAPEINISVN